MQIYNTNGTILSERSGNEETHTPRPTITAVPKLGMAVIRLLERKYMSEKIFRTYDEQIDTLIHRGIVIDNRQCVINILKEENYYSVINGYKDLFLMPKTPGNSDDCYKPGTNFYEIIELYNFDRHLREILLLELLRVEKYIKTTITYIFSSHYGYDNHKYLTTNSFNTSNSANKAKAEKLISELNDKIAKYSTTHKAISYYCNTHHYVPLWVLSTIMSFGTMNFFFSRLTLSDKTEIANEFRMTPKSFESVLSILCGFRNKCAHGERIYSYKKDVLRSKYIPILPYHATLGISDESKEHYGREDLLALLIVLKYFVSHKHYPLLIAQIDSQITKLDSKLHTISISEVKKIMGLVPNWTDLKHIK